MITNLKPYTVEWYDFLIQSCAKNIIFGKPQDKNKYSILYDYLIIRRNVCILKNKI